MRHDGRRPDQLRPIQITRGFARFAPGSVLMRAGNTVVLCNASIEPGVPEWRAASGAGWLTAEYDMLPASTGRRRERNRGAKIDGRTQEIQRLIGRALRAAIDLARLGQHTIYLDCDVIDADGGTRTAGVTGAFVALCDALAEGERRGLWQSADVLRSPVAAVSAGIVDGAALLDLDYREDVAAQADCNVVMNGAGEFIEVQSTAERGAFSEAQLGELLRLARLGVAALLDEQRRALSASLGR
ncbi:MAG: Ribonuclease PH [Phycisphaerae bacterium]|nr:Ribonuclease PH [Phycisphaerae bacterium]